jgi:kumamolisin
LVLAGTVGTVEGLLEVRIGTYADRLGRRFHAPVGTPRIPAELTDVVAVAGLDTRPRWQPHDVPVGGLTPVTAANAYDVAPLRRGGVDGHGLTVAVVSFSAFAPGDEATWMRHYGVNGSAPGVIAVDGGTSDMSGADETNLDIEVIRDIAPAARILVYEAPQSDSAYGDVISRIVADHQADAVASSWGACELTIHSAEFAGDRRALGAAIASGVTVFAASGDSGAYDCQRVDLAYHGLSVDWPAASGNVVAVGGTRLDVTGVGGYRGETAWEDQLTYAGGGGGVATRDARPTWQAAPGVISSFSNGHRQLPDVSADADPGTPWAVYSRGQPEEAGGTSAAAPFWAASMLLIDQYAASRGVHRPGYVNPLLYALANSRQTFAPFHDVTVGSNRYYQAGVGWDAATGLGSPDVFNLARDLVAYLRLHPGR